MKPVAELLVVLASLMVICPHLTVAATLDDTRNLETFLFANYSKVPRPVYNQSEVLRVGVDVYLLSIIQLDAVASSIEISIAAALAWHDSQLTWDPNDYGGLTTYTVDPANIWYPGIFIISTADELETISKTDFHADISSTGNVSWVVGKLILSSCDVDMTQFPMDTQVCDIILMPWGYGANEVALYALVNTMNMAFVSPNGEWNIDKTLVTEIDTYKPNSSALTVQLTLSRKSTYFIMSLILPMNLLGFLTPFVFFIPASSGDRISYSVTMFLSLAVYMTIVTDDIPKVSEPMAGITYYTLVTLIVSSAIVLLAIVSVRFEAIDDVDKFPKYIVRAVKWLATRCRKTRRRAKIEDGTDKKKDGNYDENGTEIKVTKETIMKYTDIFLFIVTMTTPIIINIIFLAVYAS
ncbi:acetylcholine receptor subunit beta-like 1 [Pecten maximus]|uniref:acetylcholine receptor subunit beta-like 1 n=1 Tax=Pecten maximus TaxID=6579 RepID=UPI001458FC26|nr:acetylcholine receptor subunit beta-like 1 [Pecten maximus]